MPARRQCPLSAVMRTSGHEARSASDRDIGPTPKIGCEYCPWHWRPERHKIEEFGGRAGAGPMLNENEGRPQHEAHDDVGTDFGSDFVLIAEGKPPSRIALARERMLISRLYVALLQSITDDYGAEFAAHSDSLAYRTIGIYVFLRTVMCAPARASQIAHALKLPRISVVRRLEERIKNGYVERV